MSYMAEWQFAEPATANNRISRHTSSGILQMGCVMILRLSMCVLAASNWWVMKSSNCMLVDNLESSSFTCSLCRANTDKRTCFLRSVGGALVERRYSSNGGEVSCSLSGKKSRREAGNSVLSVRTIVSVYGSQ